MHDCFIRVIHNIVTALLEYLDLSDAFPEAYVDLILFLTILVEYLHLCNAKLVKLQFSDTHFSNFSPIFLEFCSLLLASYFSKKIAGKIGAALVLRCIFFFNYSNSDAFILVLINLTFVSFMLIFFI